MLHKFILYLFVLWFLTSCYFFKEMVAFKTNSHLISRTIRNKLQFAHFEIIFCLFWVSFLSLPLPNNITSKYHITYYMGHITYHIWYLLYDASKSKELNKQTFKMKLILSHHLQFFWSIKAVNDWATLSKKNNETNLLHLNFTSLNLDLLITSYEKNE